MKVSVIMPVYNDEKLVSSSINSVLSQTYTDWELLIMNDGSADNTEKIITAYNDPRIRYFSQENKGQLVALNNLCQYITGDLVLMLHSDDKLYDDHALENNVKHFSDPSVDGVYSDFHQFFDSGKPNNIIRVSRNMNDRAVHKLITRLGSNIIIDHFFVRRDKFEKNVRFNYFKWYMPYWLNFTGKEVRCLNLKYTSTPWYNYRVYDSNYTNSVIGNFEVYFTRFRSIFFLSDYFSVPFPLLQKEISRRFDFSGYVLKKKADKKHIAECYKANIRSMRQRTPNAYTWFFEQLENFYRRDSDRILRLNSPIVNTYTPADARRFYKDLQNNTVNAVHQEIIDNLKEGFISIEVGNDQKAQCLGEILKFMCIRATIKIDQKPV